ncbi:MAG: hypothetical protein ABW352_10125 [Polyangiales bacterium]
MRCWLTVLLALAACAEEDAPQVDLCELGEQVYSDALASLRRDAPSCTRDEECVLIQTDVDCNGFSASLCGDIVHRDVASRWNADAVCAPLDAYPPAKVECSVVASCAGARPVCDQGRCSGVTTPPPPRSSP